MRLPDVYPFASPAADLLSRPSPRCGRQLHALTGQPAGPRWPQAAAVGLVLLALIEPRLYVIRNAKLHPHWRTVKRRLVPIMSRSIDTLIGTQSIGNLAELYIIAREQGLDYRFAYIPQSFYAVADEPFDKDYMNKLFRLGQRRALAGEVWLTLDAPE
jgi:hypothetical protein